MKETIITIILMIVVLSIINSLHSYDDTDDELNGERSGFILYTDHKTGCQYLRAGLFGNLIKRVDGEGHHVGCH